MFAVQRSSFTELTTCAYGDKPRHEILSKPIPPLLKLTPVRAGGNPQKMVKFR